MAKFQVGVDFTQEQVDKARKIVGAMLGIANDLGAKEFKLMAEEINGFVDAMQKALDEEAKLNS